MLIIWREKMENKQFNLNNFLKERKVKKYQDKINY